MTKTFKILPGLIFTALLAWIAMQIQLVPFVAKLHFSSIIIAIVLGIVLRNALKLPSILEEGIRFSAAKILRLAIILLGFSLSLTQIASIGGKGLLVVLIVTGSTLIFATWIGKKLGLDEGLAILIGVGTSICGASAIAAVEPVIKGEEKDATFAVATVTIFGTIAMFLYPLLYSFFHLSPEVYAVWSGASVHELAQVIAASFTAGSKAIQYATLIKLTRVLLVIPVAIIFGIRQARKDAIGSFDFKKIVIPWFVFGFLAVVIINSTNLIPTQWINLIVPFDKFLLTVAMGAMGLGTSMDKMKQAGLKPLYVGFLVWIFIGVLGFFVSELIFA